jgi:hypothetical protein
MATWGIWLFVIGRRTLTSDLGENGVKTLVCMEYFVYFVYCTFIFSAKRQIKMSVLFKVTSNEYCAIFLITFYKFSLLRQINALVLVFSSDVQCALFKLCNEFKSLGFSNTIEPYLHHSTGD